MVKISLAEPCHDLLKPKYCKFFTLEYKISFKKRNLIDCNPLIAYSAAIVIYLLIEIITYYKQAIKKKGCKLTSILEKEKENLRKPRPLS